MSSINFATREISCKVVYYGPGLSGKTTNLQVIHQKMPQDKRTDMVSLETEGDRTLFFDFLPLNLGDIKGFKTKFQLYTVPGQVYYNSTRKIVLRGVDGIVFVADSQRSREAENLESLQNLRQNLEDYGVNLDEIPLVLQYNKRDMENVFTLDEMNQMLNPKAIPFFPATAHNGKGVVTTNLAITVYSPLWGVIANLLGAAIVAATQYLCLAGPACPAVFAVIMFLRGEWEAGVLSLVLTALALYCHGKSIRGMFDGTTSRTDVLGALKKKLFKK